MAERSVIRDRLLMFNHALVIIVVICLVIVVYWCWVRPVPQPNLIIEDQDTAAWMTLTNTYAWRLVPGPNPGDPEEPDRDLRSGVLIQLGRYEHGITTFLEVVLEGPGMPIGGLHLKRGEFSWINIVSNTSLREATIDDDHDEYALYPNPRVGAISACDELHACVNQIFTCGGAPSTEPYSKGCLRYWSLHQDFQFDYDPYPIAGYTENPGGIITYWQGDDGYALSTKQVLPDGRDRFEFTFKNPFEVVVYNTKVCPPAPAACKGVTDWREAYPEGAIDRITVKGTLPPYHGNHSGPMFPPPD